MVAAGAEYRVSERLSVRAGYSYNNSPQSSDVAFFNIGAPTIIEHVVYTGFSWNVSDCLTLSLAYLHGFENSLQGPIVTPFGSPPGATGAQHGGRGCGGAGIHRPVLIAPGPRAAALIRENLSPINAAFSSRPAREQLAHPRGIALATGRKRRVGVVVHFIVGRDPIVGGAEAGAEVQSRLVAAEQRDRQHRQRIAQRSRRKRGGSSPSESPARRS